MNDIIAKIKGYINFAKIKTVEGFNWLKINGDWKTIGIAGLIGLITLSSWSAFVLGCLCCGVLYATKMPTIANVLSFINIDLKKYIINVIVGLFLASLLIFIV